MPFSELKLDRSFVRAAPKDDEASAIVRSSIDLGHELDLRVVAEGVETHTQWNLVSSLGSDQAQGHFISEPMPGPDLAAWARRWSAQAASS